MIKYYYRFLSRPPIILDLVLSKAIFNELVCVYILKQFGYKIKTSASTLSMLGMNKEVWLLLPDTSTSLV